MSKGYRRGSFTEGLVNKTIAWYSSNEVAFFKKAHPPFTIITKNTDKRCLSILSDKADIDYYGVFRGKYISFEVKETSRDFFLLSQIKEHQLKTLLLLEKHGAISFVLLNFVSLKDSVWLLKTAVIHDLIQKGVKRIKSSEISSIALKIPITLPGVVDWLKLISPISP